MDVGTSQGCGFVSDVDVGRSQGSDFMLEADIGSSQGSAFRKNGRVKLEATRKVGAPSFSFVHANIAEVDSLCATHTMTEGTCADYVSRCQIGQGWYLRRSTSSSMRTVDGYNGDVSVARHDVDCPNGDSGCGATPPLTDEGNRRFARRVRRQRSAPETRDVEANAGTLRDDYSKSGAMSETRVIKTVIEDIPRQRIRRRRDTQEEVDGLSEKRLERLNRLRRRKKEGTESIDCDSTAYTPRERQSTDDQPQEGAAEERGVEHQADATGAKELVKTGDVVVCKTKIKSILKKHELTGEVATGSGEPATPAPKRKAKSVRVRRHDSFIKSDSDAETTNECKEVPSDLSLEQASVNADAEELMDGPEDCNEVDALAHRSSRKSRAEFYQSADDYYLTLPRSRSAKSVSAAESDVCEKNGTSTRVVRTRTRNRFVPEPDDNSRVLPSETNVSATSLDARDKSRATRALRYRTRTRSAPEPDNNYLVLEPCVLPSPSEDRNSLFEPHGMSSQPEVEDKLHIFKQPWTLLESEDNSHVCEPEVMPAVPDDNSLVCESQSKLTTPEDNSLVFETEELRSTVPDDNSELFESDCIPIMPDDNLEVFEQQVKPTMPEDNSHVFGPQGSSTIPEGDSHVIDLQGVLMMPDDNSDVFAPQGMPTILEDKSRVFELCLTPADQNVHSLSPCRTASEGSDRSGRLDSHVYQSYAAGILHSSRKSGKFVRLQKHYGNLERIAGIEKETVISNSELGKRRYNVLDLRYKSLGSLEPTSAAETLVLSKYKLDSLWELKELFADLDEAQEDGEFFYDIGNLDEMQWNPWTDRGLGDRSLSTQELRELYEAGKNLNEISDRRHRHNPVRVFRRGVAFSKLREKYFQLGDSAEEVERATHQGRVRRGSDGSISSHVSAASGSYIQIMENAAKKSKQRPLYGYHIAENPNRYEEHVRMMKSPSCPDLQGGNACVDRFKRADLRRITARHADVRRSTMTRANVNCNAINMQLHHREERSGDMKVDVTVAGAEVVWLREGSSDMVKRISDLSDEGHGNTIGLSGSGDERVGGCDDGEEYPTVDTVRCGNESEEHGDLCDSPGTLRGKQEGGAASGTSVMQGNTNNSALCHDSCSAVPQGRDPPGSHPANTARCSLKHVPHRERSATNEKTGEKDDVVPTARVMKWRAEVRGLLGEAVASNIAAQSEQRQESRRVTSNVPIESHSSVTNVSVGRTSGERRTRSARSKQSGETVHKTFTHKSSKPEAGVVLSVLSLFENMEGHKQQVSAFKHSLLTKSTLQGSTHSSIVHSISDGREKEARSLVYSDCSNSLEGAVLSGSDTLAGAVHAGSVPVDTHRAKKTDLNVSDDVKIINGNLSGQAVIVRPPCAEPAGKSPVKDEGIEVGKGDVVRMFASTGILKQSSSVQGTGISEDRQRLLLDASFAHSQPVAESGSPATMIMPIITRQTDVECGESVSEFREYYDDHSMEATHGEISGDMDNNPPMLTGGGTIVNHSWQQQIVGDPPTGLSVSLDVPDNRQVTGMSMSTRQNSTVPKSQPSFVPGGKHVRNTTSARESLGMDDNQMELAAMKFQMTTASSSRDDADLMDNSAFRRENTEDPAVTQPGSQPQYLSSAALDESGVPPIRYGNFYAYHSEGNLCDLDMWPSTNLCPFTGNSSALHSSNETMIVVYGDPDLSVGSQKETSPSVKEMTSRYEAGNTEGGYTQNRHSVSDVATTEASNARATGRGQDGVVVPPKRTFESTTCRDLLELRRKYLIQMSAIDCEYGTVDSRLLTHSPDALASQQENARLSDIDWFATRKQSLCRQQAVYDDGGPPLYRDPPLYHAVAPDPIFLPRRQRETQRTKGRHRIGHDQQGLTTVQGTHVNDGDVRHPDMYVTEFAREKHRFYYGPKADMLYPPVVRLSDRPSNHRRPQQSRSKTRSSDTRRSHRTAKSAARDNVGGRQNRPRVSSATNKG